MTKKILSLIIAVLICTLSSLCVFANDTNFVVDEFDVLYEDEIEMLNAEALAVFNNTGFGVFFVYTYDEVDDDLVDFYTKGYKNFVIMFETEDAYKIRIGGTAKDHIDDEEADALLDIYADADTYRSGVSEFFSETAKLLPEKGTTDAPAPSGNRLYDGADILTDTEESDLISKLNRISGEFNVDIAIATVDGTGDMSVDEYVNYYYDNSGLGYGVEREGVLFLIDMDSRKFRILSNGGHVAAKAISSDVISDITDTVTSDLSDGNYVSAFNSYIDECEYQINGQINGFPFKGARNFIISLVIGLVIAFIVTGTMKGKLKSVRKQAAANGYVKDGSLAIYESRDTFLYSRVTRTEKADNSDNNRSSGGGSSRNVGGGSF